MTATPLQNYWWFIISLLAGALVFMLFVQGGQTMLLRTRNQVHRQQMVDALGSRWELTFTALVVFGVAFFASFPRYYSAGFGGVCWLWMLLLLSFVIQAFSYEFRRKRGNLHGQQLTCDTLLFLNGCFGCLLPGVVVGTMIFGADYSVRRSGLLDVHNPFVSTWGSPLHGLEALADWRCLLLGLVILLLARTSGAIYLLGSIDTDFTLRRRLTRQVVVNGGLFLFAFLAFMYVLLGASAYVADPSGGTIEQVSFGYLKNYCSMWWAALALLTGVILVLWGIMGVIIRVSFPHGFSYVGAGVVLVVMSLFWVMGYGGTSYFPSVTHPQSSLTLANSSAPPFTLRVMAWVTLLIPMVIGYITYVWHHFTSTSNQK